MEFGVPRRREVSASKEKYENIAVLTLSEFRGKGTGRTLTLNKKAIEVLGLDFESEVKSQVSFSFDKMKSSVSIANTTGLTNVSEVVVAKTSKSISDKPYFEAIKANFGIKLEDSVELKLTDNNQDFNGFKTFSLSILESTEVAESIVADAVAETTTAEIADAPAELGNDFDFEEVVDAPEVEESNGTEEAPLEYVQEKAAEFDAFQAEIQAEIAGTVEDATPSLDSKLEDLVSNTEEQPESDNPFERLDM